MLPNPHAVIMSLCVPKNSVGLYPVWYFFACLYLLTSSTTKAIFKYMYICM